MLSYRNQRRKKKLQWPFLSLQYQQKSDDLWWQYQEGLIEHTKYVELLEQIKKNEEIDREEKQSLIGLSPEKRGRIETDIWDFEHVQQEEREKEAERKAEEKRIKFLTPLEKCLEDAPRVILNYQRESKSYRREANIFQILIIVGSVLTTSASSAVVFGVNGIWRLIAPVISIVVTISAGLTAYFKYREKSFNLPQTADAIEQEYNAVRLGIGFTKTRTHKNICNFLQIGFIF
jgi:Protein of unknown function (DUF4231)